MKLSIIVPIYNVEKYISRCALSLYDQTAHKEDYEIIFVNDGTKDNSILNLRKTLDFVHTPNIFIVDKPNGGLSSARNYGLRHSRGEYVWFVDSDDWVDSDSVEVLLNLINQSPDVIVTTQMYRNTENTECLKYQNALNFVGKGADLIQECPPVCAVAYISSRQFLNKNNLEFREGILHEDAELIPRLIYIADKVVATDRPLYHHFMRDGSITNSVNPLRYESYFIVIDKLTQFYNEVVEKQYKIPFSKICLPHIYGLLYLSKFANIEYRKRIEKYISINKSIVKMMLDNPSVMSKLMGLLIKYMPKYSITIANLFWKLKR